MSETTATATPAPGTLGTPPPPNGAAGEQKPVTPPAAAAEQKPVADAKAEQKPADKPAEKTPEQLAAEKKAAEDKKAADDKVAAEKAKADADKQWAEFKPKRAEGITTDEATLKDALTGLREAGLSTEQAQKVIELNDKFVLASAKAQQASVEKFFTEQKTENLAVSAKKFGAGLEEATRVATKAFDHFMGAGALQKLSERYPNLNSDPVLFEAFHKVGLAMKDDSIAGANAGGANGQKTDEQLLREQYPNSPGLFTKS